MAQDQTPPGGPTPAEQVASAAEPRSGLTASELWLWQSVFVPMLIKLASEALAKPKQDAQPIETVGAIHAARDLADAAVAEYRLIPKAQV